MVGYLLLFDWTSAVGQSIDRAYEALPSGFVEQIVVNATAWLIVSIGAFLFQEIWVWRATACRGTRSALMFSVRVARSVLVIIAATSLGAFALWAAVDLALLRIGQESQPSFLVGWFMLLGIACVLVWLLLSLLSAFVGHRASSGQSIESRSR